jgi:HK97 family phage major capsid protein
MDIEELKRERLAHLNKAREIVDGAEKENRDLTDDERESYEDCNKQADSIEARVKREEELNKRHGVFASPGPKTGRPTPTPFIGMSDPEIDKYSLMRAIRAAASGEWQEASLEMEASRAVEKKMGKSARGFFVPWDWMERRQLTPEQRDLVVGTPASGGYFKGTDLLGASFIDRLVNRMVMAQAGITMLTGLVGDVAIPRLATGVTSYWVAENSAPTEGTQVLEQVTLAPKTNCAYVDISRKLLTQASLDVENMVRNDIARSIALALDKAILQGAGTNEPTGVLNTTNVVDCSGTDGDTMAWSEVIDLETSVASYNADVGRLAYITNPTIRGVAKQTLITATYGDKMIWNDQTPDRPLNGYPCFVTAQIAANLTKGSGTALSLVFFGNWADVLVGSWGTLDVLVDPYTGSSAGTVRVTSFQDTDVAVRHPVGFAFGYYK